MPEEVEIVLEDGGKEIDVEKIDPKVAQDKITPDMPRFKEVYGKLKEAERKLAEKEEKESSNEKLISEMRSHNERLAKAIEASVNATREAVVLQREDNAGDEAVAALNDQLVELREKKVNALKNFDYDVVAEIDEQIIELKDELREHSKAKKKERHDKKEDDNKGIDPAILSFVAATPWFNGDAADIDMINAAYEMDRVLLRDPKWSKVEVADRLSEVRKRVEAKFDWKEDTGSGRKKLPGGVEGVSHGKQVGTKIIKLSAEELTVAKGLGITPEAYARQKAAMGGV